MFLIALTITSISTPCVKRLALELGFVDAPAKRKLHTTPMPLMGGVAIFMGAIIAIAFLFRDIEPIRAPQVRGILLASSFMAVVGLLDDRLGLPPSVKFLAQVMGVLILVLFDVRVKLPLPLWLNYTITLVWIVGISNAINFLDNMDGLSAGISGIAAAFILLIATLTDQYLVGGVAAAILGACFGFLRYNFKPAQIFMGDAGSLFLGFLLAILGMQLRFPENSNFVTWMIPVFILGLPIFDTSLVVISRLRRGVSPLRGGKDHTSPPFGTIGINATGSSFNIVFDCWDVRNHCHFYH